ERRADDACGYARSWRRREGGRRHTPLAAGARCGLRLIAGRGQAAHRGVGERLPAPGRQDSNPRRLRCYEQAHRGAGEHRHALGSAAGHAHAQRQSVAVLLAGQAGLRPAPIMSKKDYELIARVLAGFAQMETERPVGEVIAVVAETFASALREDNPRFSRDKFLAAVDVPAKYFGEAA